MKLNDLLEKRRSYRALDKVEINEQMINELALAASKAPSCYNKQPWRYVFVKDTEMLNKLYSVYSKGNEWAQKGSLIVVVYANKKNDCIVDGREYYLFDTGMSVMNLMLKAVEMDLVVHPIAGFDEKLLKPMLNIKEENTVITLVVIGKKADKIPDDFSKDMIYLEENPSPRKELDDFISIDKVR